MIRFFRLREENRLHTKKRETKTTKATKAIEKGKKKRHVSEEKRETDPKICSIEKPRKRESERKQKQKQGQELRKANFPKN